MRQFMQPDTLKQVSLLPFDSSGFWSCCTRNEHITQTLSTLTLSDAEFDLEVDGGGHHGLSEDQDVLQADHHHQIRKNLPADRKQQNYEHRKKM